MIPEEQRHDVVVDKRDEDGQPRELDEDRDELRNTVDEDVHHEPDGLVVTVLPEHILDQVREHLDVDERRRLLDRPRVHLFEEEQRDCDALRGVGLLQQQQPEDDDP